MPALHSGLRNAEWHARNELPQGATSARRIKWHLDHARNCACPALDSEILDQVKERYLNTHQEFWVFFNQDDHRALGRWAAACAERVLPLFEAEYPDDLRPRRAIEQLRLWIATAVFTMEVIRRASLDAHAAARDAGGNAAARYAARAAGQAVATAHVPTHALGSALYTLKAVAASGAGDVALAVAAEREWQLARLPDNLRDWVTSQLK